VVRHSDHRFIKRRTCAWRITHSFNKSEIWLQPDSLAMPPTPTPSTTSSPSSTPGSSGVTEASYPPSHTHFRIHKHIAPRIPRGFLIVPPCSPSYPAPGISYCPQRDALWNTLLQALPEPCPGQYAHQQALIARDVDGSQ
jgi:hypothetical protein